MTQDIRTPCFLVCLDQVVENCSKMHSFFHDQNIKLIPHMKTHKTKEIAKLMTEKQDRKSIVVSTLAEAEFFAAQRDPPFDEITYAYHLTLDKLTQCAELLCQVTQFNLLIENDVILKALQSYPLPNKVRWNVYVDIDLLYGRTGLNANHSKTLDFISRVAQSSNVNFLGLYMHCGSSYLSQSKDETVSVIKQSVAALKELKQKIEDLGIDCARVSIGSTPSCSTMVDKIFDGIDEVHPGNYVFYDAQQFTLGSCSLNEIACSVLARVIGHYPERNTIAIDCGWEALSSEKPCDPGYFEKFGFARFRNFPNLKLLGMSQEVGKVTTNDDSQLDFEKLPIGTKLELYPWHSCATAAMHVKYFVCDRADRENFKGVLLPCRGW